MKEEATSLRMYVGPGDWKRQGNRFFLEPLEKTSPATKLL
jgi:hypothetical protein